MRCALFGPTPGSLPSSSIRSWTGPSYTCGYPVASETGQTEAAATETTGERAHLLRSQLRDLAVCVAHRGHHQVGEGLHVVRVDDLGVDGQALELAATGHHGGDQATACRAGDLG